MKPHKTDEGWVFELDGQKYVSETRAKARALRAELLTMESKPVKKPKVKKEAVVNFDMDALEFYERASKAHIGMDQVVSSLLPLGANATEVRVMVLIEDGFVRQKDLVIHLGFTRAAISQTIAKMIARKLVKKRGFELVVTSKGRGLRDQFLNDLDRTMGQLYEMCESQDLESYMKICKTLANV